MKRRILLVDDEVAVLLTLKAVLEISGFDVDTATSAREGKARIKHREYEMVITDMRMEGERAGEDVIQAAKAAPYKPAVALLSAFSVDEDAVAGMGADKVLVKPMHTRQLLQQLEALYVRHHGKAEDVKVEPEPAKNAGKSVKSSAEQDPAKKPVAKVKTTVRVDDPKPAAKAPAKPKPAPAKKVAAPVARAASKSTSRAGKPVSA